MGMGCRNPRQANPDVKHVRSRFGLDELRRFAIDLCVAVGLAPVRASSFVGHLLWFDTAGLPRHGYATLPDWLERIQSGIIDPNADGSVGPERGATAVLDAARGLGPLAMSRAAGLVIEKARDVGVGLVRVTNVGPVGPAAPIAAEIAIGPMAAIAVGPNGARCLALPTAGGLPRVYDVAIGGDVPVPNPPADPMSLLVPEGDWLLQAIAVPAIESLEALHQRLASALHPCELPEPDFLLNPGSWEARRAEALTDGIAIPDGAWKALRTWAGRLGVAAPH
jgi:LDH2 family malate/lactate/ureidoglycolate dehydrogenase